MIYLRLICIQVICVLVIDHTDFIDNIKTLLSWIFSKGKSTRNNYRLKPFDCSLCSTFWVCFFYLIYSGEFSIWWLTFSLFLAIFADVTGYIIRIIKDFMICLINNANKELE